MVRLYLMNIALGENWKTVMFSSSLCLLWIEEIQLTFVSFAGKSLFLSSPVLLRRTLYIHEGSLPLKFRVQYQTKSLKWHIQYCPRENKITFSNVHLAFCFCYCSVWFSERSCSSLSPYCTAKDPCRQCPDALIEI